MLTYYYKQLLVDQTTHTVLLEHILYENRYQV
jgi:hypothetical protein